LSLSNYEERQFLLTYCLSIHLSWSLVLTWCCTLSWVTKILMQAICNVHAGRFWPAGHRFLTLATWQYL